MMPILSIDKKKILLIYLEPTPYIIDLIEILESSCSGHIDVLFLAENVSQNWRINIKKQWMMLPRTLSGKIKLFTHLFFKRKYNMIQVAGWWGHPLLFLSIILSKLIKIPVVIESDSYLNTKLPLWKRIIKRFFYPKLFSLVNLFLPGGTRQRKYLEYYGVNPNRIIPVNMTVDVTAIKLFNKNLTPLDQIKIRERYGFNANDIVFIFVGQLIKRKGLTDLINVFNHISLDHVKLLVVGDGELRQYVENAIKVNKKICYAGRLSNNELLEAYYAADVMVLPSYFESWGLVVNEAMAMGKPVIVSERVGCVDDLVIHQQTGLVIQPENMNELQNAIEYMTNESNVRTTMGKKSSQLIANWTLENEAKKICQVWQGLLYPVSCP